MKIKTRMIGMGCFMLVAMTVLLAGAVLNVSNVKQTNVQAQARNDALKLAQNLDQALLEVTLNAKDALVDRRNGYVAPEKIVTEEEAFTRLKNGFAVLAEHSDDSTRAGLEDALASVNEYEQAILQELFPLIERSGEEIRHYNEQFAQVNSQVREAGKAFTQGISSVQRLMSLGQGETDIITLKRKTVAGILGNVHKKAQDLQVVAMDILVDRNSGVISEQNQMAIMSTIPSIQNSLLQIKQQYSDAIPQREKVFFDKVESIWPEFSELVGKTLPDLVTLAGNKNEEINEEFNVLNMRLDSLNAVISGALGSVLSGVEMEQQTANAALLSELEASVITLISVYGAAILLLLAAFWLFARSINVPMGKTLRFAEAVGRGELDSELDVHSRDEFGNLADSLRAMVEELRSMITTADDKTREAEVEKARAFEATEEARKAERQAREARREGMLQAAERLEQVVAAVSQVGRELIGQVDEAREGARVQSDRAAETATAMEQMNATVLEVARSAAGASDSSTHASGQAREGAEVVREAVSAIGRVQQQATALKGNMNELGMQADNIGEVIGVINDIADQTNLLALNAAIEAARAGEAGRGFAVVADEVRKLAEKTMEATRQVGEAIQGIQGGARSSIAAVEESVATVDEATALADQSGEALSAIVGLVDSTSDQARNIATASEEQSAASEQINRAVDEVNTIAQGFARTMDESASAVQRLTGQVDELTALIGELKSA